MKIVVDVDLMFGFCSTFTTSDFFWQTEKFTFHKQFCEVHLTRIGNLLENVKASLEKNTNIRSSLLLFTLETITMSFFFMCSSPGSR